MNFCLLRAILGVGKARGGPGPGLPAHAVSAAAGPLSEKKCGDRRLKQCLAQGRRPDRHRNVPVNCLIFWKRTPELSTLYRPVGQAKFEFGRFAQRSEITKCTGCMGEVILPLQPWPGFPPCTIRSDTSRRAIAPSHVQAPFAKDVGFGCVAMKNSSSHQLDCPQRNRSRHRN